MNRMTQYLQLFVVLAVGVADFYAFVGFRLYHPAPWLLFIALVVLMKLFETKKACGCEDFLVWSEDYATGIKDIDEDHKKLLNLINNLQAAVLCNTGETFERHNLNELVAYTEFHFQREEELMQKYEYNNYEAHKGQHDQMILNVRKFLREYDERGREALRDIAAYLRLWLVQHINGTDQQYVPFFKDKGVE